MPKKPNTRASAARAGGAPLRRLAGRVAVHGGAERAAGDAQQRGDVDRPAPAQPQREGGQEDGPEHAAPGQADLLDAHDRRAPPRREPRHRGRGRGGVERAVADAGQEP
jgi:hypothetical protein